MWSCSRCGAVLYGTAPRGMARHGTEQHGMARHGKAQHGSAQDGMARPGTARCESAARFWRCQSAARGTPPGQELADVAITDGHEWPRGATSPTELHRSHSGALLDHGTMILKSDELMLARCHSGWVHIISLVMGILSAKIMSPMAPLLIVGFPMFGSELGGQKCRVDHSAYTSSPRRFMGTQQPVPRP